SVRIRLIRDLPVPGGVAENNPVLIAKLLERSFIAEVISFHVTDRDCQHFAFFAKMSERCIRALRPNLYRLADVLQTTVAQQRAGEEPRFCQDLEPVADSHNEAAAGSKLPHTLHHRRELGNCSRPQIIPIREPAWNDHNVDVLEVV